MQTYRKIPVEVEAALICKENIEELEAIENVEIVYLHEDMAGIRVNTLEGVMYGNKGDYLIRGIKGEFYPCKPDIFRATYEPQMYEPA